MLKKIRWGPDFAYAIGLITTDGCLSSDGRHIELTSKDLDQILLFAKILKLKNKIGLKYRSRDHSSVYYRIQFGDVMFYKFLLKIGLTPNKSKTVSEIKIPNKFIPDFLRGSLDGDGYTYSYWDSKWKTSFRLYTAFTSASRRHLEWISYKTYELFGVKGTIKVSTGAYQLKYAKKESIILLKKLYYKPKLPFLKRKHSKIVLALDIISQQISGCAVMVARLP